MFQHFAARLQAPTASSAANLPLGPFAAVLGRLEGRHGGEVAGDAAFAAVVGGEAEPAVALELPVLPQSGGHRQVVRVVLIVIQVLNQRHSQREAFLKKTKRNGGRI